MNAFTVATIFFSVYSFARSNDLQDWTEAIKGNDAKWVQQLLQYPVSLQKSAYALGEQMDANFSRVLHELKYALLISDPINQTAAVRAVDRFFWEYSFLEVDLSSVKAVAWFEERSSDDVTPVSGDVRHLFDDAYNGFRKQVDDIRHIDFAFNILRARLHLNITSPDALKKVKEMTITFYQKVGERSASASVKHLNDVLDQFYNLWQRRQLLL